jgi:hypothetical protein
MCCKVLDGCVAPPEQMRSSHGHQHHHGHAH